jgi:hypothetical protein
MTDIEWNKVMPQDALCFGEMYPGSTWVDGETCTDPPFERCMVPSETRKPLKATARLFSMPLKNVLSNVLPAGPFVSIA